MYLKEVKISVKVVTIWTILLSHLALMAQDRSRAMHEDGKVHICGAMKNVMWKGALGGTIELDTIQPKEGLYGLGPLEDLRGELLVINGESFVSRVGPNGEMLVEKSFKVKAPFFVFAHEHNWSVKDLPETVTNIAELEVYLSARQPVPSTPFVFRLSGTVERAEIHVQNLPEGTKVSSPKEAHQGQTGFLLENVSVDIVGFYSTQHHGVFTHHDSNVHMHLITADRSHMGHLDHVIFGSSPIKISIAE